MTVLTTHVQRRLYLALAERYGISRRKRLDPHVRLQDCGRGRCRKTDCYWRFGVDGAARTEI